MAKKQFSSRIKTARLYADLTQNELAQEFGVSQAAVCNWEGRKTQPSGKLYSRVLKWLKTQEQARDDAEQEVRGRGKSMSSRIGVTDERDGFGAWLRQHRQSAGLTQQSLAKEAGVSQMTISLIESGKTPNPRRSTREQLAKALGSSLTDELAEGAPEQAELELAGVGDFRDFNPHDEQDWPEAAGVYVFYDISDRPVYVGKAERIRSRVKSHEQKFWFKNPIVETGAYAEIADETLRDQVETLLIRFLKSNAILNKNKRWE